MYKKKHEESREAQAALRNREAVRGHQAHQIPPSELHGLQFMAPGSPAAQVEDPLRPPF